MSDIDEYLDTALVGCKQRAAEFDDRAGWRPMSECGERDVQDFIGRILSNATSARKEIGLFRGTNVYHADAVLSDLRDSVNMGLLALSILEREP